MKPPAVALSNGLRGRPGAGGCGTKSLHKYDMPSVRLRHQSRVFAMAEVKTGPRGCGYSSLLGKETEVEDNEIE